MEIPSGELQYFLCKAQHQPKWSEEWLRVLINPMKTYIMVPSLNISVSVKLMQLEWNRQTCHLANEEQLTDIHTYINQQNQESCYEYVKLQLSHKARLRSSCAELLRGLPFNLSAILRKNYEFSKTLVFQESRSQTIERCKRLQQSRYPWATDPRIINEQVGKLENLLINNRINARLCKGHI
ncbi:hypothetical protein O0L34_g7453 [Tuta absoluta]|nr:hypothetical protein O0L34_g7453 [Tuta absoluta]